MNPVCDVFMTATKGKRNTGNALPRWNRCLATSGTTNSSSQPQRADRAAASRARDCPAPADAGPTPPGVLVPLLRQADADPPAAHSTGGGQTTGFGPGSGDGRVSQDDRQDGAPIGATAAFARKMPENRALTAGQLQALIPALRGNDTGHSARFRGGQQKAVSREPGTGLVQQPVHVAARFAITT